MMERFEENRFEPVTYHDRLVHSFVPIEVRTGDRVRVEWLGAQSPRTQGLALRLRRPNVTGAKGYAGALRIDDQISPGKALWMDTAPPVVEVQCDLVPVGVRLEVSNRWRDASGREDEWLNNYGIVIEQLGPDSMILHCSDGVGLEPTFDDLVVRLDLVRTSPTTPVAT